MHKEWKINKSEITLIRITFIFHYKGCRTRDTCPRNTVCAALMTSKVLRSEFLIRNLSWKFAGQ